MIRPSVVDLLIGCLTEWHDIKGLSVLPVWFSDRLSVCAVIQVHHVGRQAKPPKVKKRQGDYKPMNLFGISTRIWQDEGLRDDFVLAAQQDQRWINTHLWLEHL